MRKLIQVHILLFIFHSSLFPQVGYDFEWTKQAGGESTDVGFSIASDLYDNIYIAGWFTGIANFGNTSLTSNGMMDLYIAKMDPNGGFVWARRAGGSSHDQACAVIADKYGSIYVTGYFYESITFNNITLTSNGQNDIFIAKLSQNGNYYWVRQAGGTDAEAGYSLAVDTTGNIYIAGYFNDTAVFSNHQVVSWGECDFYVAKLSTSGEFLWVRNGGGLQVVAAKSLSTDIAGNIYVTGYFASTMDIGDTTLQSYGSSDVFISKLDQDGNFIWSRHAGGTSGDRSNSITTDLIGNVYVAGDFMSEASFGNTVLYSQGGLDVFVTKLNSDGVFVWALPFNGPYGDRCHAITSSEHSLYMTGSFQDTLSIENTKLISSDYTDIFIASLNFEGDLQWALQAGADSSEIGYAAATNTYGDLLVTGLFNETALFGNTELTTFGHQDIFISKLSKVTDVERIYSNDISVYPNPTDDILIFNFQNVNIYYKIELRNLYGQLVKVVEKIQSSYYALNVVDFKAGVYFYVIRDGSKVLQQGKVVIR